MGLADLNVLRILQPDGQLISMDPQLNGIPHWRVFYNCHLCPLDQSHIQEMLAERSASAHREDRSRASDRQSAQLHLYLLLSISWFFLISII